MSKLDQKTIEGIVRGLVPGIDCRVELLDAGGGMKRVRLTTFVMTSLLIDPNDIGEAGNHIALVVRDFADRVRAAAGGR